MLEPGRQRSAFGPYLHHAFAFDGVNNLSTTGVVPDPDSVPEDGTMRLIAVRRGTGVVSGVHHQRIASAGLPASAVRDSHLNTVRVGIDAAQTSSGCSWMALPFDQNRFGCLITQRTVQG